MNVFLVLLQCLQNMIVAIGVLTFTFLPIFRFSTTAETYSLRPHLVVITQELQCLENLKLSVL